MKLMDKIQYLLGVGCKLEASASDKYLVHVTWPSGKKESFEGDTLDSIICEIYDKITNC